MRSRSARLDRRALRLGLLVAVCAALACGTDAERRYASLSTERVDLPDSGYRLRFLSPPWQRVATDPLATGARKSVPIGETTLPILAGSGRVLEIQRESSIKDSEGLSFPKYRVEAALVECALDDAESRSCAEQLATLDYAARQSQGVFDAFGAEPRQRQNDAGQDYFELMGQSEATRRYLRAVFFAPAGSQASAIAGWLSIEGNPDLGEREVTELVQAFELVAGSEGEP